jgi:hypothetical protein
VAELEAETAGFRRDWERLHARSHEAVARVARMHARLWRPFAASPARPPRGA